MSRRHIKPVSLLSTFSHRQAGCMACLIASGAIGLLTPASQAALLLWNNAGGGSAATAGNWNPSQIPAPADDLQYSLAAVYAITFNGSVPASDTHTYRAGTVTLTMTAPHTVAGGATIGDLSGDVATAILTTGTWNSNGNVVIGDAAGSTGTLTVNDDDADLILGGASDLFVGSNGAGTLNITSGGNVVVADQLIAGSNATSVSNLTISGFVAQAPFPISRLDVLGTSVSRVGQGGDATMNVSNGALAQFAGDLVIANGSASTSTVTVQGQGFLTDARLTVAGDLLLGRNTSTGAAAGNATLNVNADGLVDVGGTLFVAGDPDGGSALLHTADESQIIVTSMAIGDGASLDLDGGTIDIEGGTLAFTDPGSQFMIAGIDEPVLTMINGATADLAPTFLASSRSLTLGGGTGATAAGFDVRSGSDLTISGGGDVVLGDGADDFGSMIINGDDSSMTLGPNSDVIVGLDGEGRFEAELGGAVVGDRLIIARDSGSTGFVLFENSPSTAQFNQIFVGGSDVSQGGDAGLVVNAGAVLTVTGPDATVKIWPNSDFGIASALAHVDGVVDCAGLLQLQGTGTLEANLLQLSGEVVGHPSVPGGPAVVDAPVTATGNALIRAINGDLVLGDATSPDGFAATATTNIIVGPNTVTLHDFSRADVGRVSLDGGTIAAPNGINIVNNGAMDGHGTVNANLSFFTGGSIITATGSDGITFNGLVNNGSGSIDGSKFTFNGPDGGWTGAGAINARAVFNAGTSINALANMTIGLNVADGVTLNLGSELYTSNRTVTLVDSNGIGLGSITELEDGTLTCAQGLVVNSGRVLRGRGDINTPTLSVFGNVRPGDLGDTPLVGRLDVNGDLALGGAAHAFFHILGAPVIEGAQPFDQIFVDDSVSLNGTLQVNLLNGFSPAVGTQFTIISGLTQVGTFGGFKLERPGPGRNWRVVYDTVNADVKLIVNTCVADVDHNGVVDVDDLIGVILAWGSVPGPCPPFMTGPDTNDSCEVDVDDLIAVILGWGACP